MNVIAWIAGRACRELPGVVDLAIVHRERALPVFERLRDALARHVQEVVHLVWRGPALGRLAQHCPSFRSSILDGIQSKLLTGVDLWEHRFQRMQQGESS